MITLTSAPQINSVLGGNAPVNYDRLVLSPLSLDPVAQTANATIVLTSIGNPDMQPLTGTLTINASTGKLEMIVSQLDFCRRIQLSAGQITAVINIIRNAQNALESGLINLAVVAGVQSTGT